jgi:hypothetical protein
MHLSFTCLSCLKISRKPQDVVRRSWGLSLNWRDVLSGLNFVGFSSLVIFKVLREKRPGRLSGIKEDLAQLVKNRRAPERFPPSCGSAYNNRSLGLFQKFVMATARWDFFVSVGLQ